MIVTLTARGRGGSIAGMHRALILVLALAKARCGGDLPAGGQTFIAFASQHRPR